MDIMGDEAIVLILYGKEFVVPDDALLLLTVSDVGGVQLKLNKTDMMMTINFSSFLSISPPQDFIGFKQYFFNKKAVF